MGPFELGTYPYYHQGNWRVNDLVQEMGSTQRVAQALGVSQRQVQRYLQFERGSTDKQARSPKRVQGKVNDIAQNQLQLTKPPSARGKDGVVVIVTGKTRVVSSKKKKPDDERVRVIDWHITDSEWRNLVHLAHEQGNDAASDYFFEKLYGVEDMYLIRGVVEAS